jgi:uncharacterized protein (UPF0248 family)
VTVFLKSINELVFVLERYCIFYEVRTEFLNATENGLKRVNSRDITLKFDVRLPVHRSISVEKKTN